MAIGCIFLIGSIAVVKKSKFIHKHTLYTVFTVLSVLLITALTFLPNSPKIKFTENHYKIYKENTESKDEITKMRYDIYDINGETVLSEETTHPLEICEKNKIVDIKIGMGTGISIHKYYSVEKNLFSREFSYVVASRNEAVAYISVPEGGNLTDRTLTVQNIFDKEVFFEEYKLDFSAVDTPIISADFTEGGKSLRITYLKGTNNEKSVEIITLN